jgi:hypothetical protein
VRDKAEGVGRRERSGRIVAVLEGLVAIVGNGERDSSSERSCFWGWGWGWRVRFLSWVVGELDCIRAIANSRSIILTSRVVRRCSRVTLSSCCIVCTSVAIFEGRAGVCACSCSCSDSIRDGVPDARVTLVTVVPVEGRADWPLLELSSNGGDREFALEAGPGADVVRVGQVLMSGW